MMPKEPSKTSDRQNVSRVHMVNDHAFMNDVVIATDAGWDHLYHYELNEWQKGIQLLYSFERGFGPRTFAFSPVSHEGEHHLYVMGEYAVGFAVLEWNQETKDFKEVARNQILKPMSNWTGADINVNKEGHIFVSLRHDHN